MTNFRKDLSIPGLINHLHTFFSEVRDPRKLIDPVIKFSDHLMSGLAIFSLKCVSLLDYDRRRKQEPTANNLRDLYHVTNPPCDTYLRERLDELDPNEIRFAFKKIFSLLQRGKGLEDFEYLDGHLLISGDGTGHFSSNCVSCPQCCTKKHSDGTTTYYHQMFGMCVVHPDKSNVIPLCPEPILNEDGNTKNDCERNACKRAIEKFRKEHPHLKVIFLADGLSSNAPNIKMLEENNIKYLLIAKPGDHKFLFDLVASEKTMYHEEMTKDGNLHQFNFINNVPLNQSNQDVKVNFLEYRQTDKKGKEINFSWVTNIEITISNVMEIMKAGRSRWKVENETFNTLKNLGYNFEHNYGHGKQYLSTILCMLMMMAFLIDQVQFICCQVFRKCKEKVFTFRNLWEEMRAIFRVINLTNWENFYSILCGEKFFNTS